MSGLTLTKTRLFEGVWEGALVGPAQADAPKIEASLGGDPLPAPEVTADGSGRWVLRLPVPHEAIADGVQTIVLREAGTSGEVLAAFSILAGDALGDDLRVEVDLLRAELDLLKRAFRRHCVETQ